MKKITIGIIILLVISIHIEAQYSNPKINSLIDSTISKYNIPSMVIGVVKRDTCYYGRSGVLRIESDERVNLKCKYHIGSNAKAITAFVAMKLVEENQINLDTKLLELFPNLKEKTLNNYSKITLANLLSHTANLQAYTKKSEFDKLPELKGDPSEQRMQFAKFVLSESPVENGTYSNAGFIIASLMLEKATGKKFEELLKYTLNEINLDYFIGFPNKQNHLYPSGHMIEDSSLISIPATHSYILPTFLMPAGDLSMDIVDYSKFIRMHLKAINGNCEFLTCSSYKSLLDYREGYALGWSNGTTDDGTKYYGHNGTGGTYFCQTLIMPSQDLAVIVIINSAEKNHILGLREIREKIEYLFKN